MASYVIRLVPTPGASIGDPSAAQQFLVTASGVSVASLKNDVERVCRIPSRDQELIWSESRARGVAASAAVLQDAAPGTRGKRGVRGVHTALTLH